MYISYYTIKNLLTCENGKQNRSYLKKETYKLHFKIGKNLHKRINPRNYNE